MLSQTQHTNVCNTPKTKSFVAIMRNIEADTVICDFVYDFSLWIETG